MILKPSSCIGCPFHRYGEYFTPDIVVPGSEVFFLAQNPGPDEQAGHKLVKRTWHGYGEHSDEYQQVQPQPLIGATGQLFDHKFLPKTGLNRSEISVGNAIRCRPGASLGLKADGLPSITTAMRLESSKADIVQALRHCRDAHFHPPSSTKLIVTMGRYAMFQLTGIQNEESEYGKKQGVMESWRGYGIDHPSDWSQWYTVDTSMYHPLTNDKRVFFTMHIAALFQGENKKFMHATLSDFNKIGLLLDGKWPLSLPKWSSIPPTTWPSYAAFDTEYIPDDNQLIRWSLCDTENNLYCVESGGDSDSYIDINPRSTVVIQNALADISHLNSLVDTSTVKIEDMMLADSVLWTGEPHSLNFIASKHGAFNRYKHLSKDSPQLYSALDAYEPMHIWRTHYLPEFTRDNQSWRVYKKYRLPLIDIINKAQLTGAKVDTNRLIEVQLILQQRIQRYVQRAREITGNSKFSLGGQTDMKEALYG